jgi:hypothetical protein
MVIEKITKRVRDVIGPNGVVKRIEEIVNENGQFVQAGKMDRYNITKEALNK